MDVASKSVTTRRAALVSRRSAASSGAPSGRRSSAGSWTRSTSTSSSFILIDIQKSFTVDSALAGLLATVTLVMRLVGGVVAGTAADKWGRKLPMMLSILWFSLFAFLSGFSTSYTMLFGFRALFGIGMGGEWAAGMTLVIEHWPARLRGLVSGHAARRMVLGLSPRGGGLSVHLPALQREPDIGVARDVLDRHHPGVLHALDPTSKVSESPVWLERQRQLQDDRRRARQSRRSRSCGSSSAT